MTDSQVFTLINIAVMVVVMWITPLQFIPFFIWLERKGSAIIQDRIGPNRAEIFGVRLFGMIHNLADVVKLLMKENITPTNANRFYYLLAPMWAMTVSLLPLLVIPLAGPLSLGDHEIRFQAADFGVGILYVFSVTSMGVFGVILAGWASNNKFSLLGGLRSSAQMISYELSMGLSIVGLLMVYQGVGVSQIVETQGRLLSCFGHNLPLPNWGIFLQPVGFVLFIVAAFAETNRNPFDLAEGESELVAGYHVEYSSVKFALFFMAEYSNMVVASFLISTLFFGGYQVPYAPTEVLVANPEAVLIILCLGLVVGGGLFGTLLYQRANQQRALYSGMKRWEPFILSGAGFGAAVTGLVVFGLSFAVAFPAWVAPVLAALLQMGCLLIKVLFFCWLFVWVRWTLPRFRYDQLMKLGWKFMLPLALANLLATGVLILLQKG
ncbi:MAG TPA: complex I subunit 1 family protein [bacterium]